MNNSLVSRKALYIYLDLNVEFNMLDNNSQLKYMLKRLLLFDELLKNGSLISHDNYQLSRRQETTKQNMYYSIKKYNEEKFGRLRDTYCEFLDYIEDYDAPHGDKLYEKEIKDIEDHVKALEDAIIRELGTTDAIKPEKAIDYFIIKKEEE